MKKSVNTLAAFFCGVAVCGVISAAIVPSKAAGTCPVTVAEVQSRGTFIFQPDDDADHTVTLYARDMNNLASEITNLGIWTDEHVSSLGSQISGLNSTVSSLSSDVSSLNNTVSSGKRSVAAAMYSKGATSAFNSSGYTSSGAIPTFSQLVSGVTTVYNAGREQGKIDFINTAQIFQDGCGADTNDGVNIRWHNNTDKPILVYYFDHMQGDNQVIEGLSGNKLMPGGVLHVDQDSYSTSDGDDGSFDAVFVGTRSSIDSSGRDGDRHGDIYIN